MPATLTIGALRTLIQEAEEAERDVVAWERRMPNHDMQGVQYDHWQRGLAAARARAEELNNTVVN